MAIENTTNTQPGTTQTLAFFQDGDGMEYKLYKFLSGRFAGKHAVRVRDIDAEENVGITVYPNEADAAEAYAKIIIKVQKAAA